MSRSSGFGKAGIVFAMRAEESGLRRVLARSGLSPVVRGDMASWVIRGSEVLTTVSGIGAERCGESTRKLIGMGARWIVCAGFAAGLDPSLGVGGVVVADNVVRRGDSPEPIAASPALISALPPALDFPIHNGSIVSSRSVVWKSSDKVDLYSETGAAALDMESYAAAEACKYSGTPFAIVRAITDTAGQDLPEAILDLSRLNGTLSRLAFAACRPSLWTDLLALRAHARTAADNLGEALATMLFRLSTS